MRRLGNQWQNPVVKLKCDGPLPALCPLSIPCPSDHPFSWILSPPVCRGFHFNESVQSPYPGCEHSRCYRQLERHPKSRRALACTTAFSYPGVSYRKTVSLRDISSHIDKAVVRSWKTPSNHYCKFPTCPPPTSPVRSYSAPRGGSPRVTARPLNKASVQVLHSSVRLSR